MSDKIISLYYQNVRGLRTKTNDFRYEVSVNNFDSIALTETWLHSGIGSYELFTNNYNIYRHDRNSDDHNVRGGGCLIACKNNISVTQLITWENEINYENVWICIGTNNGGKNKVYINCVYLPPTTSYEGYKNYLDHLSNKVNNAPRGSQFVIIGDFNLPIISWMKMDNFCLPFEYEGRAATELFSTLAFTNLKQFNHYKNNYNKTLDLVFSNVENITICPPYSSLTSEDNYHPALIVKIKHENIKYMKFSKTNRFNFFRANYDLINFELSQINWTDSLNDSDIDVMVSKFYQIINSLINKIVPLIKYKETKYPIWYSENLIRLIKEKFKYKNRFRKYSNPLDKQKFIELRRKIKYEQRIDHIKYQDNIENAVKENSKVFFAYTKARNETNTLPNIVKFKNVVTDDPKKVANLFADYFEEVYESNSNDKFVNNDCNCNSHLNITENEVMNVIKKLDKNKNTSPDGIPSVFYINTAKEIAKPLSIIYNLSLKTNSFPKLFKLSYVIPIHKSGDKASVTNYRPISIISVTAKIFERIVYNFIYSNVQHLIAPEQHGFCSNKSTLTNLLEYGDFITKFIKSGGQIDVIITDLKKAFDKINHTKLVNKLKKFNINPCLLNWIFSYLNNRNQIVCINNYKSRPITPTSSVPQGSILAPLLFILFINDLPSILSCKCLLFADDLKIFIKIVSINDIIKLQDCLNKLAEWCSENSLFLNESKCFAFTITRKLRNNILLRDYSINNVTLNRVNTTNDLGVIFDEKFTFNAHINNIVLRALKMLGFLSRTLINFKKLTHTN